MPAVEDVPRAESDQRCFAVSLLLAIAFGGLAMFYSLVVWKYQFAWEHHLHGRTLNAWYSTGDTWNIVDAGRYVWHGSLGYVYQAAGSSYALPLSFILAAPVSALIDHYNLVEGIVPLLRPSAWLLVGPFILLFNVFLLDAVRRLAWDLGLRRRLWTLQLVVLPLVLAPGFEWGHFEDVLALTFVLHAVRFLLLREPIRAGLLISFGVASKQWALMLVPFVVCVAPTGRRMRTAIAACGLPGMLALLVLAADPRHAVDALFSPVNLGRDTAGHLSFYGTWLGSKTSRASRTAGLLLTVGAAWPFRRAVRSTPLLLLAVSGLLLVRPLFEAINYSYYWAPGLLFAGLVGVAAHRRVRIRDWLCPLAAIAWSLPRGNSNELPLSWGVMAVLLAATYVHAARMAGFRTTPVLERWRSVRHRKAVCANESAPTSEQCVPVAGNLGSNDALEPQIAPR